MYDSFLSSLTMYMIISMPFEFFTYLIGTLFLKKENRKYNRLFLHISVFYALKIIGLRLYSFFFDYIFKTDVELGERFQEIGMAINPFNIVLWFVILGIFISNHKKDRNLLKSGSSKEKIIILIAIIIFCFSFVPWAVASMGI